jgi:hypothetical protein
MKQEPENLNGSEPAFLLFICFVLAVIAIALIHRGIHPFVER